MFRQEHVRRALPRKRLEAGSVSGRMPLDDLVHRHRPAAGDPQGALVLLQGRGVDENDLFPLLDILDPEQRLAGFTPRAP